MRKALWTAAAGLVAILPGAGVLWGGTTVLAAGSSGAQILPGGGHFSGARRSIDA